MAKQHLLKRAPRPTTYVVRPPRGVSKVAKQHLLKSDLAASLATLAGRELAGSRVAWADDFADTDPVDGSVSRNQGIRVALEDGSRIVFRLSGTGTEGATLRVYLERFEPDVQHHHLPAQEALAGLIAAAEQLAGIRARLDRAQPTVIT